MMRSIQKQVAIAALAVLTAVGIGAIAQATVVFQQNFDNPADPLVPLIGSISNDAFTSISGAGTGGSGLPRRHDLNDGNQGRLATSNVLGFSPTSSTALAGTTFSFDYHAFTSGTASRVATIAATELGTPLMSVGFDMQNQLLVNGSTVPGDVVAEPNDAFRGLDWGKATITLNATDWNLDIQRYLPQSGQFDGPGPTTVVTDPSGSPSGISDSYTFAYLNAGSAVTSFELTGNANGSGSAPLGFYDNLLWDGTLVALEPPKLLIDQGTGAMSIVNNSGDTLNVLGYSILSDSGALDQSGWTTVAGNYDATPGNGGTGDGSVDMDDNWTILTAAGVLTDLSEVELDSGDGGTISDGQSVDLGTPWLANPFGASDLSVRLLLDDGTQSAIDIEFSGADIISGDIAGVTVNDGPNGVIDVIDWLDFRANQNTDMSGLSLAQAYQRGDLDGDLDSDLTDFTQFAGAYNAVNGAGSFQAMVASVPEPTSIALLLAAGFAIVVSRRGVFGTRGVKALLVLVAACLLNLLGPTGARAALDGFLPSSSFNHPYTPADIVGGVDGWNSTGLIGSATGTDFFVNGNGELEYSTTNTANGLWTQQEASPSAWLDEVGADTSYTWEARLKLEAPTTAGDHELFMWMENAGSQGLVLTIRDNGSSIVGDTNDNTDDFHDYRVAFDAVDDLFYVWRDTVLLTDPLGQSPTNPGGGQRLIFGDGSSSIMSGVVVSEYIRLDTTGAYSAFAEPELTLEVNTTNGAVSILNDGTPAVGNVDFNAYSIRSPGAALDSATWVSLQDNDVDGNGTPNDGIGWEEFEESDDSYLSEAFLTGVTSVADQISHNLGLAFDTSVFGVGNNGDLLFEYADDNGVIRTGEVSYVTSVGVDGDYNSDGIVNAADYTIWRDTLGSSADLRADGDGNGSVGSEDYTFWKARFGNTAGSGSGSLSAAAVPEPSSLALLAVIGIVGFGLHRRKKVRVVQKSCQLVATMAVVLLLSVSAIASENDRQYDLGDDGAEGAVEGNTVGSAVGDVTFDSAGAVGAGDLQDLDVNGSPTYVSVSDRPDAGGSDLGAEFNSASTDSLSTPKSMNAPTQMWDNSTFFPGPPPNIFPHNYEGIFSHGIQLWAKPDQAALGVNTQSLVSDTAEHGIGITDTGNWSLLFDDGRFDSGVMVASTLDTNGWAHVMEISGFGDPVGGGSSLSGALLVNGVAVATRGTFYDPESTELVLGADPDGSGGFENHYDGVLDDVRLFFWGDNSDELGDDGVAGGSNSGGPLPTPIVLNADGQNWGPLNLAVDNDWIAQELAALAVAAGVGSIPDADVNFDGVVSGDGTGLAEVDDVTAFVDGWLSVREVDGLQIGDWVSRQDGDLNFDGITDLGDAFILHQGLLAAGQAGLDFSLLGSTNVPEPSTIALTLIGLLVLTSVRCRR